MYKSKEFNNPELFQVVK